MKVCCDSNVLIAAFLRQHVFHERARRVLERVRSGADHGIISAHSVAEVYAVLTRLPGADRVPALAVQQLLEANVGTVFETVALTAREYHSLVKRLASAGIVGGMIYDAIVLTAATKAGADRLYTFNTRHFGALNSPELKLTIEEP